MEGRARRAGASRPSGSRRCATKVEFTIYTPGLVGRDARSTSSASLQRARPAAPTPRSVSDEIDGYVTELLGMIGISGDPLSSREHILLANLIQNAWSQGQSLDLGDAARAGAAAADAQARRARARRVLPARRPHGVRHEAQRAAGLAVVRGVAHRRPDRHRRRCCARRTASRAARSSRPRTCPTSSASRSPRSCSAKLVTWMRRQSGTSDLRALLYMDEVAGYLPPTANPPTKKPIMLLLKQARAFGLGVVLSTQNPVDVDYKALSNAGTWLIGRLQTEQDKARLVDGLSSAAGGVDVSVGRRHDQQPRQAPVPAAQARARTSPEVMTTRWAMSYLRGPLTRDQIGRRWRSTGGGCAAPPRPRPCLPRPRRRARRAACRCSAGRPGAPPRCRRPVAARRAAARRRRDAPAGHGRGRRVAGDARARRRRARRLRRSRGAVAAARRRRTRRAAPARRRGRARRPDLRRGHARSWPPRSTRRCSCRSRRCPTRALFVAVDYDDRDLVPAAPAGCGLRPRARRRRRRRPTGPRCRRRSSRSSCASRTTEVMVNTDLKAASRPGETREEFVARCHTLADAAGRQGDDRAAHEVRGEARRPRGRR